MTLCMAKTGLRNKDGGAVGLGADNEPGGGDFGWCHRLIYFEFPSPFFCRDVNIEPDYSDADEHNGTGAVPAVSSCAHLKFLIF